MCIGRLQQPADTLARSSKQTAFRPLQGRGAVETRRFRAQQE